MSRQHGQSMVEFAIAVSVLILLGLGMSLIARYHDIQRQAILAARQGAFSASWLQGRVTPVDLEQQGRELHFRNEGWRDPTGQIVLPANDEAIHLSFTEGPPPGTVPSMMSLLVRPLQAVGGFLGADFDLSLQRFHRANVTVELPGLPPLPAPFDQLALQLQEQSAVLGDPWQSGSPEQVARRTAGLVPTSLLASQAVWLKPVLLPLTLIEPAVSRLCLGLIEPEWVPVDRLEGGVRGMSQPGTRGCR